MQIEKREIVKCVLLSFITCGIYGILWAIKLGRDAVQVRDQNDSGTMETVLIIFFPFIGFYLAEKKFAEGLQSKGIPHNDNSIMYLVLGLFCLSIVDYCLLQNDLNKLVESGYATDPSGAYTNQGQAYNPNFNQQYNPNVNQQYNPNANPQYNPNVNQQYNPNANQQYNPNANQQYSPDANPQNNNYPGNNSQGPQDPMNPQY